MADPQSSSETSKNIKLSGSKKTTSKPRKLDLQRKSFRSVVDSSKQFALIDFSKLTIEWRGNLYHIEIKTADSLVNLKHLIYTAIKDDLFCDLFSNIFLLGTVEEEDLISQKLQWNSSGAELKITAVLSQHLSDLDRPSSVFYAYNKPVEPQPSGSLDTSETPHFKILNKSREGKKLVILDIDHTIYDVDAAGTPIAARPYLEDFVTGIYEYYDIGLWSATDMDIIEIKLDELRFFNNPLFNILFYAGANLLVPTCIDGDVIPVKSLDVVWARLPRYNETNTLLCDDQKHNFFLQKDNGIEVKPYRSSFYRTDEELLHLLTYLRCVSRFENLALLDNRKWRKYVHLDTVSTGGESSQTNSSEMESTSAN